MRKRVGFQHGGVAGEQGHGLRASTRQPEYRHPRRSRSSGEWDRRLVRRRSVKPLGTPNLDDGLARWGEALCFLVEFFDHPDREIDIDPLRRLLHAPGLR